MLELIIKKSSYRFNGGGLNPAITPVEYYIKGTSRIITYTEVIRRKKAGQNIRIINLK